MLIYERLFPTAYYVFSAYSLTSVFFSATGCATFDGPRTLIEPLAVPIPLPTDQARFALDAETAIASYLEPTLSKECPPPDFSIITDSAASTVTVTSLSLPLALQLTPIAITLPISTTVPVDTTTFATGTSPSQSGISPPPIIPSLTPSPTNLAAGTKTEIGISTPLGTLAFLALSVSIWAWYRRRPSELQTYSRRRSGLRSGWRAYFQNKGELDAEEQRRHEAEDTEVRREVDAEEQVMREVEGTRVWGELDSRERHELEEPERRHELDGSK